MRVGKTGRDLQKGRQVMRERLKRSQEVRRYGKGNRKRLCSERLRKGKGTPERGIGEENVKRDWEEGAAIRM